MELLNDFFSDGADSEATAEEMVDVEAEFAQKQKEPIVETDDSNTQNNPSSVASISSKSKNEKRHSIHGKETDKLIQKESANERRSLDSRTVSTQTRRSMDKRTDFRGKPFNSSSDDSIFDSDNIFDFDSIPYPSSNKTSKQDDTSRSRLFSFEPSPYGLRGASAVLNGQDPSKTYRSKKKRHSNSRTSNNYNKGLTPKSHPSSIDNEFTDGFDAPYDIPKTTNSSTSRQSLARQQIIESARKSVSVRTEGASEAPPTPTTSQQLQPKSTSDIPGLITNLRKMKSIADSDDENHAQTNGKSDTTRNKKGPNDKRDTAESGNRAVDTKISLGHSEEEKHAETHDESVETKHTAATGDTDKTTETDQNKAGEDIPPTQLILPLSQAERLERSEKSFNEVPDSLFQYSDDDSDEEVIFDETIDDAQPDSNLSRLSIDETKNKRKAQSRDGSPILVESYVPPTQPIQIPDDDDEMPFPIYQPDTNIVASKNKLKSSARNRHPAKRETISTQRKTTRSIENASIKQTIKSDMEKSSRPTRRVATRTVATTVEIEKAVSESEAKELENDGFEPETENPEDSFAPGTEELGKIVSDSEAEEQEAINQKEEQEVINQQEEPVEYNHNDGTSVGEELIDDSDDYVIVVEKDSTSESESLPLTTRRRKTRGQPTDSQKTGKQVVKPVTSKKPKSGRKSLKHLRQNEIGREAPKGSSFIITPGSVLKNPDADTPDVRRSTRIKMPPLQFWKNERIVYTLASKDNTEYPEIKAVVQRNDTLKDHHVTASRKKRPKSRISMTSSTPAKRRKKAKYGRIYNPDENYDSDDEQAANAVLGKAKNVVFNKTLSGDVQSYSLEPDDELPTKYVPMAWGRELNNWQTVPDAMYRLAPMYNDPESGATCGILAFEPNGENPTKSTNESDCFFYVISGAFQVNIAETIFTIVRGGTFVVPKGNVYSITNIMSCESKLFFVHAKDTLFHQQKMKLQNETEYESEADVTVYSTIDSDD